MQRGLFAILILLLAAPPLSARTLEGVELAEAATARDGTTLQLHGAGVRSKFFFDIYVGALYLPRTGQEAEEILAADQPGRIEMHFVYDEVSRERLVKAWRSGFEANNPPGIREAIADRLDRFVDMFPAATGGDRFTMEYLPGSGTRVAVNGEPRGTVEGGIFFRALLGVFLGPEPPDDDLREGMLGRG